MGAASNNGSTTVGGLLAPSSAGRGLHSRAVSLPAFSQELFGPGSQAPTHHRQALHHQPQGSFSGFSSAFSGGLGNGGFGLTIQNDGGLPGWAEEEIGAK